MRTISINLPFSDTDIESLQVGDKLLLTGVLYTARDAAHKRLLQYINEGEKLPFSLAGQIIYYAGPTPTKPGCIIGSVGPTTSGRMDGYTPTLLDFGLKGIIGKGPRSQQVIQSLMNNRALYMIAIGGAGVVISETVTKAEIVAFEDLGAEAIFRLEVKDFPCYIAIDYKGNSIYNS